MAWIYTTGLFWCSRPKEQASRCQSLTGSLCQTGLRPVVLPGLVRLNAPVCMPLPTGEHQALGDTVFIITGIRASWDQWSCLTPQMPKCPDGGTWFNQLCCSAAQSCPPLCDPKDCSMLGIPVPHHLLKFAQVHVYCIGVAIQPSHPLMPSSLMPSSLPSIFPSIRDFPNESAVSVSQWLIDVRINQLWCLNFIWKGMKNDDRKLHSCLILALS